MPGMGAAPPPGSRGYVIQVVGVAATLEICNDLMHLMIIDKRSVHSDRYTGARWQEQHISITQEIFCSYLVQNGARVHL